MSVEHFSVSVFPFEMEWNILIAQFEIIFFCGMSFTLYKRAELNVVDHLLPICILFY